MSRIRSNRVCFTVNNYAEEDTANFIEYVEGNVKVKYAVCGEEIGKQGTLHLQGYIHLDMDPQKGGIKFWKSELPFGKKAHFESARGTDQQNQAYCTKDGIFYEKGTPSETSESIWKRLVEAAEISMDEVKKVSYEHYVRFHSQLESINARAAVQLPETDIVELNTWQAEVVEKLKVQTKRKVLFVIDYEGGKGKTELTKWMKINMNAWSCQGILFISFYC